MQGQGQEASAKGKDPTNHFGLEQQLWWRRGGQIRSEWPLKSYSRQISQHLEGQSGPVLLPEGAKNL